MLPASPIRRVAVVTHGKPETIGSALTSLERIAAEQGVELLHEGDDEAADLAVVLGGDGTMLRALQRFLGTGTAVIGVNFGRVGFLTSIAREAIEAGLSRVFAGDYSVHELATLEATAGEESRTAVNDVVATSSTLGRIVELGWAVGDEDLGVQPCDGVICATPSGSTAYNLSSGGPVLVWGLDAMAVTFVAPHSLHARPLVVPRTRKVRIVNQTPDVALTVLADGHAFAQVEPGRTIGVGLGERRALLATLPEETFFRRYRDTFASGPPGNAAGGSGP